MRFESTAILLSVVLSAAPGRATTIIEETFTGYQDDSLISDSPAGPALGLAGDWTLVPKSDFYVNRTQVDLGAGTGKAVYDRPSDDNGTREATRDTSADHVLLEADGDDFYASFLIEPGRVNGRMTLELKMSRLDGGGVPDFSFGIADGEYIVGNGGVDIDASGGEVAGGEQRVVVRVEYGDASSGPDDDEVITLWVDPADELSLPVIDSFSTDFLNRGGAKVTAIAIRGESMLGAPAFFDELRVATSFDGVIELPPPTATRTPTAEVSSPTATKTPHDTPNPSTPTHTAASATPTEATATETPEIFCVGDCDGDGSVTVSELIRGVNISLDLLPLDRCPAFDRDGDGEVEISELVTAVNNSLAACLLPLRRGT
jgi:hypothetical protein